MDLAQYRNAVERIPYGKRLPGSLYLYRSAESDFGFELNALLAHLAGQFEIGPEFNVLKLRWDELKISFLAYPNFFETAHPELQKAVTIDLASAKVRRTDPTSNPNPPILQRPVIVDNSSFPPPLLPRNDPFRPLSQPFHGCEQPAPWPRE